MSTTRERDGETESPVSETGHFEGTEGRGRIDAAKEHGSTPLNVLRRMVHDSWEEERRPRVGRNGPEGRSISDPTAFEILSRQVRAAQRAGQLKAGDSSIIATLLVGAVLGAADFARRPRASRNGQTGERECPPLFLLNLLGTKSCN